MRVAIICCTTLAVLPATTAVTAAKGSPSMGTLNGSTKIDTGCPVPGNSCTPWRLYPNAKFTITRLTAAGAALVGTTRTVDSNAQAHFHLLLHPGPYLIKPTPDLTTKGGSAFRVRVEVDVTKTVTVHYVAKYHSL